METRPDLVERYLLQVQNLHNDRFGRPHIYNPWQAKATNNCNLNICYLQRLIANVIVGHNDSQNVCQKVELFLIWCALLGTHADTGAFLIHLLLEVAKTTYKNVIGVGGTITIIAQALGRSGKFSVPLLMWIT